MALPPVDLSAGSSLAVDLTVTLTYVGAEDTALTATMTAALGTPDSNADDMGVWTTSWQVKLFSLGKGRGIANLFERVIGSLDAAVHTIDITWPG